MNNKKQTPEQKQKSKLITDILLVCKANKVYISGDLFFKLAFMTIEELKNMHYELYCK